MICKGSYFLLLCFMNYYDIITLVFLEASQVPGVKTDNGDDRLIYRRDRRSIIDGLRVRV